MWALKKLRKLMTSHFGANINVSSLLASPTGETAESDSQKSYSVSINITFSVSLILPDVYLSYLASVLVTSWTYD